MPTRWVTLYLSPNHQTKIYHYISLQDDEFFYGGKRQNRRDVSKRANRDHKFAFDVVFGPNSTNEDVFQETTRDLVDVLFAGEMQT